MKYSDLQRIANDQKNTHNLGIDRITYAFSLVATIAIGSIIASSSSGVTALVAQGIAVATIYCLAALRIRNTRYSMGWFFLSLVPLVGWVFVLALLFISKRNTAIMNSEKVENRELLKQKTRKQKNCLPKSCMLAKDYVSMALELADQHLNSGKKLVVNDGMGPSECVLLWLGVEQCLKSLAVATTLHENRLLDSEIQEGKLDQMFRDLTFSGHGIDILVEKIAPFLIVSDRQCGALRDLNIMFNRRYLRTNAIIISDEIFKVVLEIRVVVHSRIRSLGVPVVSRYDLALSPA